jgi:protein-disulfide isomerase
MENKNIEDGGVGEKADSQNNSSSKQIAGAIFVAGIIIAGAILLKGNTPTGNTPVVNNNAKNVTSQGRPVTLTDHIAGNKNAKIVIVEYSDLECPFCKMFHATMHKVIENNKNVAWVYRHYPISQLHSKAPHEAEATECAWEQGGNDAFWKYTNRVFERTASNNKLDESELPKIAEDTGLNVALFNTCLSSGKYKEKIQADIDDGNKAGVNGTPSSFILVNGKVVDAIGGAQSYEVVMQKLSEIK